MENYALLNILKLNKYFETGKFICNNHIAFISDIMSIPATEQNHKKITSG